MSASIASIGKRTPGEAAQDAAELCRLANSLGGLNEIACNSDASKIYKTRIKAVLEQAGLVLNHFNSDPRASR